ncbi:MAG: hypothetical protein IT306_07670 [Chloroflexi bacterium]|nr:hypothetical protein [Chloroflexota bacterium]
MTRTAGEASQVVLDVHDDPEIDDHYLVCYVRLPEYEHSIMERIHRIAERFEDRSAEDDASVLIATDYHPAS